MICGLASCLSRVPLITILIMRQIQEMHEVNKSCIMVLVDLQNAFDKVPMDVVRCMCFEEAECG